MSRSSEIRMARPLKKRPLQVPSSPRPQQQQPQQHEPTVRRPSDSSHDNNNNYDAKNEDDHSTNSSNKRFKLSQQRTKGAAVLELLPGCITGNFGLCGFAVRNGKKHAPAKIMNPFDVSKTDREEWKQEFCKLRDSGEPLESLPFLVYWFGRGTYELVSQSEFVSYEKAPSKLIRYAKAAQQKRDQNIDLSKSEQRRLDEMNELMRDMGGLPEMPSLHNNNPPEPKLPESKPDKTTAEPARLEKSNTENNGAVHLIKRPRGRPPFGKVWDPVRGVYQSKEKPSPQESERLEHLLEVAKKDAKARLEREKAQISRMLPDTVKSKFGRVGFAKWGKVHLPALVLNPFHVPPGEARDTWMDQFHEMKNNVRSLNKISLLVFWYGELDPPNFYSLVPISAFVPYDEATDKMLEFARKAEYKRAGMKKLTDDDKQRIRAMQELVEDLEKHPEDRRRGICNFKERHELLTIDDMDDIDMDTEDEEELNGDDSGSVLEDDFGDEESNQGKLKNKESGYSSLEDSDDDGIGDDSSSSGDEDDDEIPVSRRNHAMVARKASSGDEGEDEIPVSRRNHALVARKTAGQVSEIDDSDHGSENHETAGQRDKDDLELKSDLVARASAQSPNSEDGFDHQNVIPPQPKSQDFFGDEVLSDARSNMEHAALAAIRSSGVLPAASVSSEHIPVLEVFTQIVKQVCMERDNALEKVRQLEALLKERDNALSQKLDL